MTSALRTPPPDPGNRPFESCVAPIAAVESEPSERRHTKGELDPPGCAPAGRPHKTIAPSGSRSSPSTPPSPPGPERAVPLLTAPTPWQKGTNENAGEFVGEPPKGTDLSKVTEVLIKEVLGYRTTSVTYREKLLRSA